MNLLFGVYGIVPLKTNKVINEGGTAFIKRPLGAAFFVFRKERKK